MLWQQRSKTELSRRHCLCLSQFSWRARVEVEGTNLFLSSISSTELLKVTSISDSRIYNLLNMAVSYNLSVKTINHARIMRFQIFNFVVGENT